MPGTILRYFVSTSTKQHKSVLLNSLTWKRQWPNTDCLFRNVPGWCWISNNNQKLCCREPVGPGQRHAM